MLRHGLEVEESVSSELPGVPNGVWTVKVREDGKSSRFYFLYLIFNEFSLFVNDVDAYDSYIILSFVNGTLVLSIGETIEEVADTGFLSSAPTLAVQQLSDSGGLIQVHPGGVRHVRPGQGQLIESSSTNPLVNYNICIRWRRWSDRVARASGTTGGCCDDKHAAGVRGAEFRRVGVLRARLERRATGL